MVFRPRQFLFSKFRRAFWRFFAVPQPKPRYRPSLTLDSRGSALIMASIFMIVAAILVVAGVQLVKTARQQANQQAYAVAMAQNAAQAGLEDALGWFKRQTNQPVAANPLSLYGAAPHPTPTYPQTITTSNGPLTVTYNDQAFNPVYNTSNPVSTDTIDPYAGTVTGIGLVNEFSPDGAGSVSQATTDGSQPHWERYEVYQQQPGAMNANAVHDVTGERIYNMMNGQGYVWDLQSTGYYYIRRSFSKSASAPYYWTTSYKTTPNQLLATARMATEIRKISTAMSWGVTAALYLGQISKLNMGTDTFNSNENVSNVYPWASASNGKPVTAGPNEVHGTGITESGSANLNANAVFGFQISEFANLSDVVQATTTTNFSTIPPNSMIYCNGNLTIDPAGGNSNWYLIGAGGIQSGLLVVNGNFTMNSTASIVNQFYGMIYVNGSVNLNGSLVSGSVIVGGNYGVTLVSSNGNPAAINYSPRSMATMQTSVSGYLEDISARKLFLAIPND